MEQAAQTAEEKIRDMNDGVICGNKDSWCPTNCRRLLDVTTCWWAFLDRCTFSSTLCFFFLFLFFFCPENIPWLDLKGWNTTVECVELWDRLFSGLQSSMRTITEVVEEVRLSVCRTSLQHQRYTNGILGKWGPESSWENTTFKETVHYNLKGKALFRAHLWLYL